MHILDAKIIFNKKIAENIYLLSFEADKIAKETKPGQFIMLKPALFLSSILKRPFSICFINENQIFILYKIKGKITKYMSFLKKDDVISIIGPLGNSFFIPHDISHLILIGGGIGVAPLLSLLSFYYDKKALLIAGYSSSKEYIDVKRLVKGDYEYIISTEDGSLGYKGNCVELLENHIKKEKFYNNTILLCCGPMPMLKRIAAISVQYGISCYVSLETYMGCGIGLCQGCVIKTQYGYKRVCKEGPIFKAEDICWDQI